MAIFFEVYRTSIINGVAQADSELVTFALYAPGEPIDANDGAALRITDTDNDGLISRTEFRDATGGGGLGQNAANQVLLFDQDANPNTGTLYSSDPFTSSTDLNATIDALPSNFPPVDPDNLSADTMVPCFAPGTRIRTPSGNRCVEDIRPGDLVCTLDSGSERVIWVKRRAIALTTGDDRHRPILFRSGALGERLPSRDLIVSPQHRIFRTIGKRFSGQETLILAKAFVGMPRIRYMWGRSHAEYWTILLRRHAVIYAEGAPEESFYPGPYALKTFNLRTRNELRRLMPDLVRDGYGPFARRALTFREARAALASSRTGEANLIAGNLC